MPNQQPIDSTTVRFGRKAKKRKNVNNYAPARRRRDSIKPGEVADYIRKWKR